MLRTGLAFRHAAGRSHVCGTDQTRDDLQKVLVKPVDAPQFSRYRSDSPIGTAPQLNSPLPCEQKTLPFWALHLDPPQSSRLSSTTELCCSYKFVPAKRTHL